MTYESDMYTKYATTTLYPDHKNKHNEGNYKNYCRNCFEEAAQ